MSSRAVLAKRTAQSTTVKPPQSGANFGTQAGANRSRPPGSSMAGQVAFSQAAQQQFQQPLSLQQQQQMGAPPRSKVGMRPPSQTPGPQLTQQQQYNAHFGGGAGPSQAPPPKKISIESAFAMTTIRLSVAEQNIIDIQAQIGDILMNGMTSGAATGYEEYDEEGNMVMSMAPPMAGAGANTGISVAQFDALKKEVDDLKGRFMSIEKMGKDVQSATLATNNAMTMIKKLSTDNMQFKNQITHLTNLLNKTTADIDRKFNDMAQSITTLEYNQHQQPQQPLLQQQQMPSDEEEGIHMEIDQIHEEEDSDGTTLVENPMYISEEPLIAAPVPAPSANEPMKIVNNGLRRGGAAAAVIAASASANGNKRAPPSVPPSIDL